MSSMPKGWFKLTKRQLDMLVEAMRYRHGYGEWFDWVELRDWVRDDPEEVCVAARLFRNTRKGLSQGEWPVILERLECEERPAGHRYLVELKLSVAMHQAILEVMALTGGTLKVVGIPETRPAGGSITVSDHEFERLCRAFAEVPKVIRRSGDPRAPQRIKKYRGVARKLGCDDPGAKSEWDRMADFFFGPRRL